jgi:DUF1680 family protein
MKAFANGIEVSFKEETKYPFEETIKFTFSTNNSGKTVSFPFHLRRPVWCKSAVLKINGKNNLELTGNKIAKITKEWKSGDVVELQLPMHIF